MTASTCALQESDVTFQQDTESYVLLKSSGTGTFEIWKSITTGKQVCISTKNLVIKKDLIHCYNVVLFARLYDVDTL